MFGALLALTSAAFFGLNSAATRRGVLRATVLQGMAITVPLGVPIFVAFAFAMGGFQVLADWELAVWFWMVLAGIVHFVIGRYGNYRATQALGSTLSTPIQQLSILVALALGFAFLGETINAVNLAGIGLVIIGPMLLVRRRDATKKAARAKGFQPDFGPGMFWGGVSAFGYGTSPLFIVLGLAAAGGGLADSAAGVMVSYIAATLVVAAMVIGAGGRKYLASLDRSSARWFVLSAIFAALSQLLRYLALAVAPISVVVPIQRLSVVFRLLFNAVINRDYEVFDRWIIVSILLAVLGAIALGVETEMLLGWLSVSGATVQTLTTPLF